MVCCGCYVVCSLVMIVCGFTGLPDSRTAVHSASQSARNNKRMQKVNGSRSGCKWASGVHVVWFLLCFLRGCGKVTDQPTDRPSIPPSNQQTTTPIHLYKYHALILGTFYYTCAGMYTNMHKHEWILANTKHFAFSVFDLFLLLWKVGSQMK